MPPKEIMKLIGTMWSELTTKPKDSYKAKAEKLKVQYVKDRDAWVKKYGPIPKKVKKSKRLKNKSKRRGKGEDSDYTAEFTDDEESEVVDPNRPDAPKRPNSVYLRYLADVRSKVIKAQPELNNKEIMIACAAEWKKLKAGAAKATKAGKAMKKTMDTYQKAFDKETELYKAKMDAYTEKWGKPIKRKRRKKRTKKSEDTE